jgi:hypothetical protein
MMRAEMGEFGQGLWLTAVGMAATVAICAAVIGLVRLIRLLAERANRAAPAAEPEDQPPLPVLAAAVAAMLPGRPHRIVSVQAGDSSWNRAGREDLARTEGGNW